MDVMKKFLPKIILTIICFSFLSYILSLKSSFVFADYQSAYSDYSYAYGQYRSTYNDYQVAKSTFLTYHTLVSQNEAINKLRAVSKARDQVVFNYYNLLQEKLNDTVGITGEEKTTFGKIKDSEKTWLAEHQTKIDAAGSLEDLNSASTDFENQYPQMDTETKQTIGQIYIAKETSLKGSLDNFITDLTSEVSVIRENGENTTFAQRGLINTKSKLDLFQTKMTKANEVFQSRSSITLFEGQQRLQEANQYLREAISYLFEIIKSFTG